GTILINQNLTKIRKYLLDNKFLYLFHRLDYKVFGQADMGDCAILVLRNKINEIIYSKYSDTPEKILDSKTSKIDYPAVMNLEDYRLLVDPTDYQLFNLSNEFIPLSKICKFYNGIKTGNNTKFLSEKKLNDKYKPVIRGKDFQKYSKLEPKIFVLFDPRKLWSNCDESKLSIKNKIFIRQTGDTIIATYDDKGLYPMDTVHIIYESQIDLKVLLGIINSKIFNKLHSILVPEKGKTFAEVKIANLKKIRIPPIQKIIKKQDEIKKLVDEVLQIKKQSKIDQISIRKLAFLDKKLNSFVYELYNLTPEEIKIIEGEQ
ncbi:MAG: hypothetical protein N3A69_08580, partial [Leptospiraceae bacterium]|nr:hypothetical protein [Leptospiraceae bacterium]